MLDFKNVWMFPSSKFQELVIYEIHTIFGGYVNC